MGCASGKIPHDGIVDSTGMSTVGAPRHDPRWWRAVDAEALSHAWCCDEDARAAQSIIRQYENQEPYYRKVWGDVYEGHPTSDSGARERLLHAAYRWLEGALLAAESSANARRAAKALLGVRAFGRHLDLVVPARNGGGGATVGTSRPGASSDLFARLQVSRT